MDDILVKFHEAICQQDFDDIRINSGGCAKAAYEFYKTLRKQPMFKIIGVKTLSRGYPPKVSIKHMRKRGGEEPSQHFCHLVLVFAYKGKRYVVDAAHGVHPEELYHKRFYSVYRPLTGYIPPQQLRQYCLDDSIWNRSFNSNDVQYLRKFLRLYNFEQGMKRPVKQPTKQVDRRFPSIPPRWFI